MQNADHRVSLFLRTCFLLLVFGQAIIYCSPSHAGELGPIHSVENFPDKPSVLVFHDGTRFETTLFEVRVLGVLKTERKAPYLVLEGRGCTDCDANTSVYIHSSSDGAMRNAAKQPRYAYPGRELSYEDGKTILYEARMFFGNCLQGRDNAVIWYERSRDKAGAWQSSVFVVVVHQDVLTELRLKNPLPSVSQSLNRVAAGQCRELEGVELFSEP